MTKVVASLVSFNTKDYLQKCLEDLSTQKTDSTIEIWVLDNNSEDGSPQMVEKKFPKVKLIKSESNLGFARGQNEIINKAQADYYLIVNPDTQIPENAAQKMIGFFKDNPSCGLLSCKLVGFDGKLQSNGGDLPFGIALLSWLFNLESLGIKTNFHREDRQFYEQGKDLGWVGGTFMMIKKQVLEKVGLLDEKYFMYVEDVEFCFKAKKSGFKVMINPEVLVKHKSGASSQNPKFYQWKSEFQNLILFYQKNLGLLPAIFLKALIYLSILMRMIMFALLGKGGKSRTYAKIFVSI